MRANPVKSTLAGGGRAFGTMAFEFFTPGLAQIMAAAGAEFAIPFVAISYGEQRISSSITGILIATVPLATAFLQRFFGISAALSTTRLAGLILGFLGVAVLLGSGAFNGADDWTGVACLLLAALGYALGPLIVERYLAGLDSLGAISASLIAASCMLIGPAVLQPAVRGLHMASLLAVAGLGLICTAVAMLLMFYLVRHAGASRAVVITYINPVVATLLGIFLLDEHLGWSSGVAFALILTGSWLATRGRAQAL